jgi:Uma2 family endonuclease
MNVYPIPNLVTEVLYPGKDNIKRDKITKFADYAAHGIPEYWIVDPKKQFVEQYLLSDIQVGQYGLYKKVTTQNNIESVLLLDFSIPVKAIFDAEENAKAIQQFLTKK